MGGLFSALEIGRQSLLAQQLALHVTGQNISNVNTPGYIRKDVDFEDTFYIQSDIGAIGSGVQARSIESFRDRFLNLRISQEMQNKSSLNTLIQGMQEIESIMAPSGGGGIRDGLKAFFASLQALATDPTNMTLRSDVLEKASNLAGLFHQTSNQVLNLKTSIEQEVSPTVDEINNITSRIADLNMQLLKAGTGGGNASDIIGQRDQLINDLSEHIGIMMYEDDKGMITIQTEGGGLLVSGKDSYQLSASTGDIFLDGKNITETIKKGKLGGILKLRDEVIPETISKLDTLAGVLINDINTIHQNGYDLNDNSGSNFFTPFTPPSPGDYSGAARTISLAISSPDEIAASNSAGTPGNNSNLQAILGIENDPNTNLDNLTPEQYLQTSITSIGLKIEDAKHQIQTKSAVLNNLQNMKDSLSGVSLDEEAAKLIEYQRAYEASARFIKTISDLTGELINILGG